MEDVTRTVLVLDDDEVNLMILNKGVLEADFAPKSFLSPQEAWDYLQTNPDKIDIALIDKMMPEISGLELLRRIKSDDSLKHIPVIIQTGDVGVEQMREGLEEGAFYYLTKPYHPEILQAILHSASKECETRTELRRHASESRNSHLLQLMNEGEFVVHTLDEARLFAATVAEAAAYPEFAAVGLIELLSNAIDHGNLEIGYEQKRKWLLTGLWDDEYAKRMDSADYAGRAVTITIQRTKGNFYLMIKDQGKGFEWQNYLYESEPHGKLNEPNGRGIAKAAIMLDDVRYVGDGNEVHCNIKLQMPSAGTSYSDSLFRNKIIN